MQVTDARISELIRHHKERAIYFEQMSDDMRHMETYKESLPHWELVDILRHYKELRAGVVVPREPAVCTECDGACVIDGEPCWLCHGGGVIEAAKT